MVRAATSIAGLDAGIAAMWRRAPAETFIPGPPPNAIDVVGAHLGKLAEQAHQSREARCHVPSTTHFAMPVRGCS